MAFMVSGSGSFRYIPFDQLVERNDVAQVGRTSASRRLSKEREQDSGSTPRRRAPQLTAYSDTQEGPQDRHRVYRADQIMTTDVVSLQPQASLAEAWRLFQEHRFRHVPICDQHQRVLGMLSDRDMLLQAVENHNQVWREEKKISDIFHDEVVSASPDTSIRQIAEVLFLRRIGAMPIVDGEGKLAGIITRSDILHLLVHEAPLEIWI